MIRITTLGLVAALTLSACNLSSNERAAVGGMAGAAAGLVTADVLNANRNWTIAATLAGAAAGVMVARNTQTGECAYSNGYGSYYVRSCR